jgi:hypothetical protein
MPRQTRNATISFSNRSAITGGASVCAIADNDTREIWNSQRVDTDQALLE